MECLICSNENSSTPSGFTKQSLCYYLCNLLGLPESKYLILIQDSSFCADCYLKLEDLSSLVTRLFQIQNDVKELLLASRERSSSTIPIYKDDNAIKKEISNSVLRDEICEDLLNANDNESKTEFSLANFQTAHEFTTKLFNGLMEHTIHPDQLCSAEMSEEMSELEDPLSLDNEKKIEIKESSIPFYDQMESLENEAGGEASKMKIASIKSDDSTGLTPRYRLRTRKPKTPQPDKSNSAVSTAPSYKLRRRDPSLITLPEENVQSYITSLLGKSSPAGKLNSSALKGRKRKVPRESRDDDPEYNPKTIGFQNVNQTQQSTVNYESSKSVGRSSHLLWKLDPAVKVVVYQGVVEPSRRVKPKPKDKDCTESNAKIIEVLHSKGHSFDEIGKLLNMSASLVRRIFTKCEKSECL